MSGKSQVHGMGGHEVTPVLLDFLEDDSIFMD